ncbi:MAG: hypothetical protein WAT70_07275 [Rhizobiaceae bacterium]
MKRAAAAAILALGFAGSAHATGEILCASADGEVAVDLLVGRTEALVVLRAMVTVGGESWSSDPAVVPGTAIALGQGFEGDGMLLVDLLDEPAGAIVARLRAFTLSDADAYASGGVFSLKGKGAFVVDCSERG